MRGFVFATALLILTPAAASAQGTLAILMPGAGGASPNDFLVRNEARIRSGSVRTYITTSSSDAASRSREESARGTKVVIVGMSKGAGDVGEALAAGAQVRKAVLVSGIYARFMQAVGSPAKLPRTLVVHHARDACRLTSPEAARGFVAWSGGKARVTWINTSGPEVPNPCGPMGAHGFYRQDGGAVSAINSFIRS